MKSLFAVVVAIIALLFTAACQDEGAPTPTDTPTPAPTLPPGTTPTPTDVCLPNPDPASSDVLIIDTPRPGDAVSSPITVSGQIAAFEATFKITIFAADGSPITDVVGMSQQGQVLSPFSEEVGFTTAVPKPACLWVYEASARDGSPIHVGQVPILLLPPP